MVVAVNVVVGNKVVVVVVVDVVVLCFVAEEGKTITWFAEVKLVTTGDVVLVTMVGNKVEVVVVDRSKVLVPTTKDVVSFVVVLNIVENVELWVVAEAL